jgi:transcriptional regulator with XRE-family HTH domain
MVPRVVDGTAMEGRRLAAGFSRERLGAAAGGVASATIVRIERGQVTPHPRTMAALLAALELEEARGQESKSFAGSPAAQEVKATTAGSG